MDDEEKNISKEKNIDNDNVIIDDTQKEHDDKEEQKTLEKSGKVNYAKEIIQMILYFVVVIGAVILIHQFVGQQIEVSGSSMESTLHNKDHLILEKVTYQVNDPKRFDIIVFRPYKEDKDLYYIKRVIGLPGETIQIIGSDIYINGVVLKENYGKDPIQEAGIASEKIVLGQDEYFLLGDNRNNSKDSRDSSVGVVKRQAIIGRAWVRVWPMNKLGVLEHQ